MKFDRHLGRRLRRWLLAIVVAAVAVVALVNNWVINNTYSYIYDDWSLLPDTDVGLVLGTSNRTRSGAPNPQFYGRINAAAQLYQLGKIKRIIVSGANPDSTYNEPRTMRRELIKATSGRCHVAVEKSRETDSGRERERDGRRPRHVTPKKSRNTASSSSPSATTPTARCSWPRSCT